MKKTLSEKKYNELRGHNCYLEQDIKEFIQDIEKKVIKIRKGYGKESWKDWNKLLDYIKERAGKVRGLLCYNCNAGVGMFREDTSLLKKAIKYIEEYNGRKNR